MAKRKTPDEDQPNDQENFNESDDTFGLPEIEYEPIDRDKSESTEAAQESTQEESSTYENQSSYQEETQEPSPMEEDNYSKQSYSYSSYQEESSPVWPKALLIVILIVVVLGGGLWYFLYYKPQKDEEERLATIQAQKEEMARRREKAVADSLALIESARQQRIADSLALVNSKPAEGTIEQLGGRTGLYYVIISSNVDDDLLMDHAKKLSAQGVSSKIIPPFGKVTFYRLAIAEGNTYRDAQAKADQMKGDHGDGLWVLKY